MINVQIILCVKRWYRKNKNQTRISVIGFVEEDTMLRRMIRVGLIGKNDIWTKTWMSWSQPYQRVKYSRQEATDVLRKECRSGELSSRWGQRVTREPITLSLFGYCKHFSFYSERQRESLDIFEWRSEMIWHHLKGSFG